MTLFKNKSAFLAVLLITCIQMGQAQQQEKPNIVVFFVDDLGWQDTSEPFYKEKTPINKLFHTPHIEALAQDAVKFTDAYATPVCTPSRVSFLTGLNAAHHKVTNWTNPKANTATDNPDELLTPPDWNINGLSPIPDVPKTIYATPFPSILKEHGYYTIHIGKAHWGAAGTPGSSPLNLGFMVNVAGHAAGHPQNYYGEKNYGNIAGKASYQAVPDLMEYHGTSTFLTEALTQEALKAIKEPIRRKEPFFLHFSNYAVHVPIQPDPRFVQKYLEMGLDSTEAAYSSLVEGYDKSIGDIVKFLKDQGVYDNTVIVFISDNGGLSLQPMRTGPSHTQNLPLKAGKGSLYEGGIRVPLLIKNVGQHERKINHNPVIIEDLFPTILDLAKIDKYQVIQRKLDGQSLVELLTGADENDNWKNRSLIWNIPNKWTVPDGPAINFFSAIRQGDYKLLYDMKNGKVELYDLSKDIGEKNNLAEKMKSKTKALSTLLSEQLKRWNAQLPTYKSNGSQVPYPDQIKL
ncbi:MULTISPECIES: sulfatase [unclassified Sphingobacterium]|uniref:sulfatase n=1 Tax=unclassified Sphingobacterium TaxID=2609468 RepID=UPI0010458B88|nr:MULTISPECIES: sulfatase [unclassified Sphingobacterium]MCS3556241.1 arylsulfatase A-like enzyme [Sphingobacterium sp. JUb21]TCR08612.1 arylsulfatase A-like enzyme [Sphingobacterium sp. JUb20]